jgi:hypothetical protein
VSEGSYLDLIDRDTPGSRDDVSPLFANGEAFAAAICHLATRCESLRFDVIAAIDALGYAARSGPRLPGGLRPDPGAQGRKPPVQALHETFTDYTREEKRSSYAWTC